MNRIKAAARREAWTDPHNPVPSIGFEVQLIGVFESGDSEDLAVLEFCISLSDGYVIGRDYGMDIELDIELDIDLVFASEITDITLFRPSKSLRVVGVYEPLSSSDATDENPKIVHNQPSLSTVHLHLGLKHVVAFYSTRFSAAFLIKGHAKNNFLKVITAKAKSTVYDGVRRRRLAGKIMVDAILQPKANSYFSPLSWAAGNGWVDYFELRKWTRLDEEDKFGRTPLSWAAGNGQERTAYLLLEKAGTNINQEDNEGRTPLSWAAGNGCDKIVQMLLEKRDEIVPGRADKSGRTPLSWAAGNGHSAVLSLLTNTMETTEGNNEAPSKMDFDAMDEDSETPLSRAAQKNDVEVIQFLVEEGLKKHPQLDADIPGELSWALSYLHKAVENGWFGLVDILMKKKVKVDSLCRDAALGLRTPLCIAAEKGHSRTVDVLLKAARIETSRLTRTETLRSFLLFDGVEKTL